MDTISDESDFDDEAKRFIAEFYAFGITGVIVSWAQRGMKETPEYVTSKLRNVSFGTKKFAAARLLEDGE